MVGSYIISQMCSRLVTDLSHSESKRLWQQTAEVRNRAMPFLHLRNRLPVVLNIEQSVMQTGLLTLQTTIVVSCLNKEVEKFFYQLCSHIARLLSVDR